MAKTNHTSELATSMKELLAKLKGVEIIKEPQKVIWGGYSSYVSDLDGNLWEIAFNPFLKLKEDGSVPE